MIENNAGVGLLLVRQVLSEASHAQAKARDSRQRRQQALRWHRVSCVGIAEGKSVCLEPEESICQLVV